jgi:predicted RNA-binding Zn ribbon-like protein
MQTSEEMVGGSPWVNVTNTVCYTNGVITDRLDEEEYLYHFLLANELCSAEQLATLQARGQQEELRSRIKELRTVFFRVIDRIDAGKHMTAEQAGELAAFVNGIQVEYAFDQPNVEQAPVFRWRGQTLVDDLLLQVVNSFTTTIETVSLDRIRKCEHDQCILHFVDTSKAGKRRWCSMTTCGNRYKAQTYYTKHKRKVSEATQNG